MTVFLKQNSALFRLQTANTDRTLQCSISIDILALICNMYDIPTDFNSNVSKLLLQTFARKCKFCHFIRHSVSVTPLATTSDLGERSEMETK
jgi:hypothetical protein